MASSGPSRCRSLRAAVGHPAAAAPPTTLRQRCPSSTCCVFASAAADWTSRASAADVKKRRLASSHLVIATSHGWHDLLADHAFLVGMIISHHDMVSALLERASRPRIVSEPLLGSGVSVLSGICDRSGSVWQLSVALHEKLKWIPILYHTNDLKSGPAGPEPSLRRCRFVGPHVTDERAPALFMAIVWVCVPTARSTPIQCQA